MLRNRTGEPVIDATISNSTEYQIGFSDCFLDPRQ